MKSLNLPMEVKLAAWGAVGGAVLTMLVGFQGFGWYTSGSAEEMAANRAEKAVIVAYAPVCAQMAAANPAQLALMMEQSNWQRDSFVRKAGWASGVEDKYQSQVAGACAEAAAAAFEASQSRSGT